MNIIWIGASAFLGGIVAALLGWCDSGEDFVARKFTRSVIAALLSAVGFAVTYSYINGLNPIDIGIAFLGGAGVDVLSNRIAGTIKAGMK